MILAFLTMQCLIVAPFSPVWRLIIYLIYIEFLEIHIKKGFIKEELGWRSKQITNGFPTKRGVYLVRSTFSTSLLAPLIARH